MLSKLLKIFIPFVIVILIWKYFSIKINNIIILPPPEEVLIAFKKIYIKGYLFTNTFITLKRIVLALMISFLISVVIGFLCGFSKWFYGFFNPLLVFLQSIPSVSWILLALIWFNKSFIPYFIIFLTSSPIMIINIAEGIKKTDSKLIEMADLFKVSRTKKIFYIYLPSLEGYIYSALKTSIGFSFKVGIMAELISHSGKGIGERLNWARINLETSEIIAWSLIAVLLTFIFDKLLFLIMRNDKKKV